MTQLGFTADAALELKDAGLIAADAAAQVGGSARVIDVGPSRFDAVAFIDVTAIEVATGDEAYLILVQGSNSSTFASGNVNLAGLRLGDSSVTLASADDTVGRYEIHFTTERLGTLYRYVRIYVDVAGTVATGINFTARLAPQMGGGA